MQIQKIFSTHLFICISIRIPGKTLWWWLGRGGAYKCLKQTEEQPLSNLRAKDVSLDWLRSRLKGIWLESIELDEKNGVLKLKSLNEDKEICFGYINNILNFVDISKHGQDRNVFFSDSGKTILSSKDVVDFFDEIDANSITNPQNINLDWVQNTSKKTSSEKAKKINRKIENIKKDINKLEQYKEMYSDAKDLEKLSQLDTYLRPKIKIKFNKIMNAHQKADLIFKKAKAYKHAIEIQMQRLENAISLKDVNDVPIISTKPFALNWKFSPTKKLEPEVYGDIKVKYFASNDYKIAIGLNAKSNDYIRKAWAKKGDLWAHIENVTGAHIIIKTDKIPDIKDWECFASVLKEFSNYPGSIINIVWTEIQYVKAVKGNAGLVRFTKEKRLSLNYEQEWMNLLCLRSN